MRKFKVTFYCEGDSHYEKTFEANDLNSLLNHINEQKYILINGKKVHDIKAKRWKSHTVIYMDSVISLSIDEVLYEDDSFKNSIDYSIR